MRVVRTPWYSSLRSKGFLSSQESSCLTDSSTSATEAITGATTTWQQFAISNRLDDGNKLPIFRQFTRSHLLLAGLHWLHAHLVEEASSFARETERDVLKVLLNTPLVRICLIAFQTVWVEPGRDCSGSFEEVRGTQG